MDTFVSWILAIGGLGLIVLTIFAANYVRGKIVGDQHWEHAVVPAIGFLAIHLSMWWMWPEYWIPFYRKNGFVLLQMVGVLGIYSASLTPRAPKTIGKILTWISVVGLVLNAYSVTRSVLHPPKDILLDGPGAAGQSASAGKTGPGYTEILAVNEQNCQMIAQVAARKLDAAQALQMANIARSESGCNQFRPDGTVYEHIPRNGERASGARGYFMFLHSHDDRAKVLELNLDKPEDNVEYAVRLAMENIAAGRPVDDPYWLASRGGRGQMYASASTTSPTQTATTSAPAPIIEGGGMIPANLGGPQGVRVGFFGNQPDPCKRGSLIAGEEWSEWKNAGQSVGVQNNGPFLIQDGEENEQAFSSSVIEQQVDVRGGKFRVKADPDHPRTGGRAVTVRWSSCS